MTDDQNIHSSPESGLDSNEKEAITSEAYCAMEAELKKANLKLEMLSKTVLGGAARLSIDDSFRIITATDGYYRMTGYTEEESCFPPFLRKGLNLVLPQDHDLVMAAIEKLIRTSAPINVTYRIRKKDGSIAWNTAYCAQIEDNGRERTVDVFFMDVTDRHTIETELESLVEAIPDSLVRAFLNGTTSIRYINQEFYRQTGYTAADFSAGDIPKKLLSLVHPDDRPALRQQFLEYFASDRPDFSIGYRIITKGGCTRFMHVRATRQREDSQSGQIIQFLISDVTEEMRQKEAIALNEERYRIISEQTRDTVFEWDIVRDRIQFSPVYEKMFGYPPPPEISIRNLTEHDIIYESDKPNVERMIAEILSGAPCAEAEYRARCADGSYIWCRNRVTTIFDSDKRPMRAIGLLSDIDDYKQEAAFLLEKAMRDSLTGLLNRMAFQKQVEHRLKKSSGQLHAFLLFDIDRFKEINDSCGHSAGDAVLRQISLLLSKRFRDTDVLGRMGGDEFAVFLPDLPSKEVALKKACELNREISALSGAEFSSHPVSASIGISLYPCDGKEFQALYRRADQALYLIKRSGGNSCCLYSQDDCLAP